jgi:sporulation protein YlmC with PRC-barrel domain
MNLLYKKILMVSLVSGVAVSGSWGQVEDLDQANQTNSATQQQAELQRSGTPPQPDGPAEGTIPSRVTIERQDSLIGQMQNQSATDSNQIQLQNIDGESLNLDQLLGRKEIVLLFSNEIPPQVKQLSQRFKRDDLVFITVKTEEQLNLLQQNNLQQRETAAEPSVKYQTQNNGNTQSLTVPPGAADREHQIANVSRNENRFGQQRVPQGVFIIIDKDRQIADHGVLYTQDSTQDNTSAETNPLSDSLVALYAPDDVAMTPSGSVDTAKVQDATTPPQDSTRSLSLDRTGPISTDSRDQLSRDPDASPLRLEGSIDLSNTVSADQMMNTNIENSAGEKLGDISDFLIRPQDGRVAYALLGVGGFLNIGEKLVAVPWSELRKGTNQQYMIDVQKQRLESAPDYKASLNQQPKIDPEWQQQVDDQLGASSTSLLRLTELQDYPITNSAGEKLGKVDNLLINHQSSEIRFVVLSFGGFLGVGDKEVAIPWNQVAIDTANRAVIIDIPRDQLQRAPDFDDDRMYPENIDTEGEQAETIYQNQNLDEQENPVVPQQR